MKKFKKNWIKVNDEVQDQISEEIVTEEKEEEKMGFFEKHKKGLIFGGLGTLAAAVVGILIACKGPEDDIEDSVLDDDFDDGEDSEEADSDEAEA